MPTPRPGPDAPPTGGDWLALCAEPLPLEEVGRWLVRPDCGATVVFTGTVRDHSDGRDSVSCLTYEAYEAATVPRLEAVATEARGRWPGLGRIALLHRVGELGVGEAAVVVGVGAGHRGDAFAAAHWCIDAVKASVPIWKRERWAGGEDWGLEGAALVEPDRVAAPGSPNPTKDCP